MTIVKYKNYFFALSGLMVAASLASIAYFGLSLGTDFTGGALVEVEYADGRPAKEVVLAQLEASGVGEPTLREAGETRLIMRSSVLSDAQKMSLAPLFSVEGKVAQVVQMTEVGPTIGQELRSKAVVALVIVMFAILMFVAFAFRKVSKPVSSWMYGGIALVTLVFDVIIPVGAFAAFGYFFGAQVDTLFVTAMLTILGYSVHDTIVVFDRTRENLRINADRGRKEPFTETAGRALGQTFVRSVNTSVTTGIALLALYVFGPETTKDFSLTLLVGIIAGTYSSIYLATPLLVAVEEWQTRRSGHKK